MHRASITLFDQRSDGRRRRPVEVHYIMLLTHQSKVTLLQRTDSETTV